MEFTAEKTDYNVAEFYDNFAKSLPKIVLVNQGFYGEISADTFDRGQVLRIHTISQQSRIIAKAEHHGQKKFFSIPMTYQSNFCVIKHGRAGKELSLSQIIREHTLPTKVQFPKNKSIAVGNHTIHTNLLPTMELTRVFNEVYLLGNFIIDGVLANEIVHVPLYLSQLRFSLVTGIVGQSKEKWKGYQDEINRSTLILEFDREFGNPDIAEYHQGRIEKVAVDADLEYAKIEPNIYTNFHTIFRAQMEAQTRGQLPAFETQDNDPNVYETISHPDDSPVQMTSFKSALETAISTQKKAPPTAPKPKQAIPTPPSAKEGRSGTPPAIPKRTPGKVRKTFEHPKEEPVYTNTRILPPEKKPEKESSAKEQKTFGHPNEGNVYTNTELSEPQIAHSEKKSGPLAQRVAQKDPNKGNVNTNTKFPEPQIVQPEKKKSSPLAQREAQEDPKLHVTPPQKVVPKTQEITPPPSKETTHINVESLSIEEVGTCMKALKLEPYIAAFKDNLIDGKLLKELDKDMMKTEFKMSAVEAIRLMMFIKEGHIPS